MSFTCASHLNQCTVQKALLWGMSRSHLHQANIQVLWRDRFIHVFIGLTEALPIVGQIISLIELGILNFYRLPKPISLKPPINGSKEKITRWPPDYVALGLKVDDYKPVDEILTQALSAKGMMYTTKKTLNYRISNQTAQTKLPITLHAYEKDDRSYSLVWISKKVFRAGGERKLKLAYELTTGQTLIKKRLVGDNTEEYIVKEMIEARKKRGIFRSVIWRESIGKNKEKKRQMIEPMLDGTLPILFGTTALMHFKSKKRLVFDLLSELQDLHIIQINKPVILRPPFGAYHADIKPENILVSFDREAKIWRAEFCDFGKATANPTKTVLSTGYTPPEYIHFYQKMRPRGLRHKGAQENKDEFIDFNLEHGQPRDIWSLGLVILSILAGNKNPLCCVNACVDFSLKEGYKEAQITTLKQEILDREIDQIKYAVLQKHPEERVEVCRYINLVKKMLRIEPKERAKIGELLAFVNKNSLLNNQLKSASTYLSGSKTSRSLAPSPVPTH